MHSSLSCLEADELKGNKTGSKPVGCEILFNKRHRWWSLTFKVYGSVGGALRHVTPLNSSPDVFFDGRPALEYLYSIMPAMLQPHHDRQLAQRLTRHVVGIGDYDWGHND